MTVNASYRPTVTMQHPPARPLTRQANRRLLRPDLNPNNGRHARWCSCLPGYVCEDHRLHR